MEHNIIVNNSRQVSTVVTALQFFRIHWHTIEQLANLVGAFNPLPDFTDDDLNSLFEIQEQFSAINVKELEAEKPKPEHRYLVTNIGGEIHEEFDDLERAWDFYEELYRDDANKGYFRDAGMYTLTDQLLDEVVTEEVPQIGVEIRFDASIDITIDGHSADFDDLNDEVREDIGNSIGCGNTYDWLSYDLGDVAWYQIQDWEAEHDETESEVSTDAEKDNTEA